MTDATDPPAIELSSEVTDGEIVIRVVGEFDIASRGRLLSAVGELLAADSGHSLVLDLAGVSFMDSSGLDDVIRAHQEGEHRGVRVVVRGTRPHVRRVFELTGLLGLLDG